MNISKLWIYSLFSRVYFLKNYRGENVEIMLLKFCHSSKFHRWSISFWVSILIEVQGDTKLRKYKDNLNTNCLFFFIGLFLSNNISNLKVVYLIFEQFDSELEGKINEKIEIPTIQTLPLYEWKAILFL